MDARAQRTLLRLGATLLILVVAVILVAFTHDDVLRTAGIGLAVAAILSLEEFLKNSGDKAAPTVEAVNAALQENSIVSPPKVRIPPARSVVVEGPVRDPDAEA